LKDIFLVLTTTHFKLQSRILTVTVVCENTFPNSNTYILGTLSARVWISHFTLSYPQSSHCTRWCEKIKPN